MLLNSDVGEDSWESLGPLDCKEIQPVNPKRNQSWIFIGRTDAEAETPILWPPDAKNQLIGKDPDAGKIECRRRRGWQRMRCWMASPTLWPWIWASSGSWWWTGKPGVLHSMGSQRVGHDWVTCTELKSSENDGAQGASTLVSTLRCSGDGTSREAMEPSSTSLPPTLSYTFLPLPFLNSLLLNKLVMVISKLFSCVLWTLLAIYQTWGGILGTPDLNLGWTIMR